MRARSAKREARGSEATAGVGKVALRRSLRYTNFDFIETHFFFLNFRERKAQNARERSAEGAK